MGMMDRDYWKEDYDRRNGLAKRGKGRLSSSAGRKLLLGMSWVQWLAWIVVGLLARAAYDLTR
jgi:hypothetical protein